MHVENRKHLLYIGGSIDDHEHVSHHVCFLLERFELKHFGFNRFRFIRLVVHELLVVVLTQALIDLVSRNSSRCLASLEFIDDLFQVIVLRVLFLHYLVQNDPP